MELRSKTPPKQRKVTGRNSNIRFPSVGLIRPSETDIISLCAMVGGGFFRTQRSNEVQCSVDLGKRVILRVPSPEKIPEQFLGRASNGASFFWVDL